ncbi:hypothetical protein GZH53_07790 [Flavihumibacter sp. R14]|nr:hypothetical protein [Flavihumibacter soli]
MRTRMIILALCMAFAACTDKLSPGALNGTYQGRFFYRPSNDLPVQSGNAEISFSENRYSSGRNASYIPAGGSGTLEILEENVINFSDENIWTANFDWGLILEGKYNYRFKGDSLILTRSYDPCPNCNTVNPLYEYRLKRLN